MQLGQALHDDLHRWWAEADPKTEWVVSDDRRPADFVIDVPMPPVDQWQMRANDVVQNLRGALDALTRHAAVEFAGPSKKIDIGSPAAMTGESWGYWKGHRYLTGDVANRFRSIQPFETRRLELHGLREVSNLEKHEFNVSASCQPAEPGVDKSESVRRWNSRTEWTSLSGSYRKLVQPPSVP